MTTLPTTKGSKTSPTNRQFPIGMIFIGMFTTGVLCLLIFLVTPFGAPLREWLAWALAFDSTHNPAWYITRTAGIIAYLLVWLSTIWGLLLPTKVLNSWLHPSFSFDFHQFISLLSFGFLAAHLLILLVDGYVPYSLAQIFIPFLSPYRPLWIGIGVIAFYGLILVTVTFYIRSWIGQTAFRYIHYTSLLAYIGSTLHGILSGTDTKLPAMWILYTGTALSVLLLTAYWLTRGVFSKD